jgi:ectoine hydroxylase-related dioxygenase (phytanoyl-CoA dioxygenase family)
VAPDLASSIQIDTADVATIVAQRVESDGYAIVDGVLSADRCDALRAEIDRVEVEFEIAAGTNEFEGFETKRIFNLIARSESLRELPIDEGVLGIVEAVLGEECLLSGTTSMHIGPGETPQLLHSDDSMITLPRPHPATMVTTMWALSEFRADNGATHLVPGSHLNENVPKPGDRHEPTIAEMTRGSVLFLHGSTWHGGGHNTTVDEYRYGVSVQYVAGWCRQQQNLMLGTPPEQVAVYPRRLQELIGYSLYKNAMGHVNREHPLSLIGLDVEPVTAWEKMKT